MSYCINPNCRQPQNAENLKFCITCGTKLLVGDRYRALKVIGEGGFGKTFLAQDEFKPSKPFCVIKQFNGRSGGNLNKAIELFNQEAVRLEELGEHPQIPDLFAHLEQDGYLYIVQEFIDGKNLSVELTQRGVFKEEPIRELLLDLLDVLRFIHERKVIHRDIKPDNILRRKSDNKLVLVDFGAAKYAANPSSLAQTGTSIGTMGYVAPEQLYGKATFASDIYSLGVTAIHLLTLVHPSDLFDPYENNFAWRSYLKNPISNNLAAILDKMIAGSTKYRYQSAYEVIQDLTFKPANSTKIVVPVASPAPKKSNCQVDKELESITAEMTGIGQKTPTNQPKNNNKSKNQDPDLVILSELEEIKSEIKGI